MGATISPCPPTPPPPPSLPPPPLPPYSRLSLIEMTKLFRPLNSKPGRGEKAPRTWQVFSFWYLMRLVLLRVFKKPQR